MVESNCVQVNKRGGNEYVFVYSKRSGNRRQLSTGLNSDSVLNVTRVQYLDKRVIIQYSHQMGHYLSHGTLHTKYM